ncbi:RND transporter hydrophobe/amphiphile efflux-1 (HAE1) family [Klebsiella pneumoniae]|uniref:RND transporter hydrophobe/amphiphile efflux-1 (HAE1) family n=1 Tax=Klebsiella pneumoniae TaxID=573 RepID=A0A377X824_KLEPN|nr:RND transporter hydrophobe/amphiphile efflux-1 (HAE1) family [Klebsiella pneumoniae]
MLPGVKKVNILGEQAERIYLSFSHDRLATLGLSPEAIFAALNSQNVLTAAGAIETRGGQIFIRLDGAFDRLQQIRDTPIIAGGRTLKLADVATVERGYEDPATFLIRHQGEPALLLGVVMREGWNGLALGKALDAETASINQNLPLGMSLTKVTDQSVNISAAVDEFMIKFFVALLVVMTVCFVSMGWRVGVVVAAAVPLTLAVVFVVMAATDKNFDRITLGSLILALGLLVDDAIIAIEMMVVKNGGGVRPPQSLGLCLEPYRRAHAGRYPGDGRGLYAQWICAVHRRGVRQQCVLDRRYRADCLLDCGGDFYPLAGGAPVAGQKARGGRPRRAV